MPERGFTKVRKIKKNSREQVAESHYCLYAEGMLHIKVEGYMYRIIAQIGVLFFLGKQIHISFTVCTMEKCPRS